METKDIKDLVDTGFKDLAGKVDDKFKAQFETHKTEMVKEIEGKGFLNQEAINELIKEKTTELEAAVVDLKKANLKEVQTESTKSFNAMLKKGLGDAKDNLINLKSGSGTKSTSAMLFKADEDLEPANFDTDAYGIATTQTRGLYENPYQPQWFRNLLPQGTTTSGTIQYLKEDGDVGAAGVWDGTGAISALENKPGTAPLFDSVVANVMWIAGITRVKREMLDDVAWLRGYLARRLTIGRTGLWVAENTQIYNTLVNNSVAYNGTKTIPIEILADAAFGQLADNYYYNPTILMNSRDLINLIYLNKADGGSEEYDLPPGTVSYVNGQLTLGGARVIGAPNIDAGEYIVFDPVATEFISRMSPEVRFFEEDRDNVPKNLITVRAEERILPLVYDNNAVIHGTFEATT